MKLNEVIKNIPCKLISGSPQVNIKGISEDSRRICPGWLFIARNGLDTNGHLFIDDALSRGAAAVIISDSKFIDSVNAMLIYIPSANMSKFVHFLSSKLRLLDIRGVFLAVEKGLDPILMGQLTSFTDEVIDLDRDGD